MKIPRAKKPLLFKALSWVVVSTLSIQLVLPRVVSGAEVPVSNGPVVLPDNAITQTILDMGTISKSPFSPASFLFFGGFLLLSGVNNLWKRGPDLIAQRKVIHNALREEMRKRQVSVQDLSNVEGQLNELTAAIVQASKDLREFEELLTQWETAYRTVNWVEKQGSKPESPFSRFIQTPKGRKWLKVYQKALKTPHLLSPEAWAQLMAGIPAAEVTVPSDLFRASPLNMSERYRSLQEQQHTIRGRALLKTTLGKHFVEVLGKQVQRIDQFARDLIRANKLAERLMPQAVPLSVLPVQRQSPRDALPFPGELMVIQPNQGTLQRLLPLDAGALVSSRLSVCQSLLYQATKVPMPSARIPTHAWVGFVAKGVVPTLTGTALSWAAYHQIKTMYHTDISNAVIQARQKGLASAVQQSVRRLDIEEQLKDPDEWKKVEPFLRLVAQQLFKHREAVQTQLKTMLSVDQQEMDPGFDKRIDKLIPTEEDLLLSEGAPLRLLLSKALRETLEGRSPNLEVWLDLGSLSQVPEMEIIRNTEFTKFLIHFYHNLYHRLYPSLSLDDLVVGHSQEAFLKLIPRKLIPDTLNEIVLLKPFPKTQAAAKPNLPRGNEQAERVHARAKSTASAPVAAFR